MAPDRYGLPRILWIPGIILLYAFFCTDLSDAFENTPASSAEKMLAGILRIAPSGIGVVKDRDIFIVNDYILHLTGYSREELVGRNARIFYPSDEDYDYVGKEKYRQIAGKGTGSVETRWQHKDGTIIYVILSSTPLDEADLSAGVVFTVLDITKRKQSDVALKNSEERFFKIFNANPAPLVVSEIETGRIIDINDRWIDMLGYSKEEQIGRTSIEVGIWSDPAVRGRIVAKLETHGFFRDEPVRFRTRSGEDRFALWSGEVVTLEGREVLLSLLLDQTEQKKAQSDLTRRTQWFGSYRYIRWRSTPHGNLIYAAARDITERKKAEQNLSSTLSLLDAALESTEDGILVINSTGKITKMNQKFLELWQIPAEFAISSEDNTLWQYAVKQLADPEAFLTKVRELYDAPADASFDEIEFSDGRVFERYSQPQWLDKQIVGRVWSFRDVTFRKHSELEREKLQAQLTQAQKMESVGWLAGGVAHDFNNMLSVILGHSEMALEKLDPAEPLFASLQAVHQAAKRSAALTPQLLDFARKQTVVPKVIDLNETVEGMLNMLRRLIGEDIDLLWKPGRSLRSVKVDPSQIDQLLVNLCVNARDAIARMGKITIETASATFDEAYCAAHLGFVPGEYVLLAVSDDGHGMDQETLGHIFEPFFTTKEQGKGTGLGLASLYGAVKQNNGFINVYSEPGQGTTFRIYLPRYTAKSASVAEKAPDRPAERGHETILLVEDEPAILEMTTMMLTRLGYIVVAAFTPKEAIRLAHESSCRIDLLMTDVVMPEMNGRELVGNLLAHYPDLKRLLMSGYTANVIAHHGVLDKGVHFIKKPFSMKDLGGKLREALEG